MATMPQPLATPAKAARKRPLQVGQPYRATHEPIAAAQAKAHFLRLLAEVERDRKTITISKRGRIIAQLSPAIEKPDISAFDQIFGRSKGQITITGDIVSPDWDAWGPEWR